VVALYGAMALTLRGVARDLGVSAASLVRRYGNIDGFRAAVAAFAMEEAAVAAKLRSPAPPDREMAAAWVAFALASPRLYRFLAGETWHLPVSRSGYHGVRAVPSPRLVLEHAFARGTRARRERARRLAVGVQGLALARLDGAPEALVDAELDRLFSSRAS
jgi:AcrR family transcriptional regulator